MLKTPRIARSLAAAASALAAAGGIVGALAGADAGETAVASRGHAAHSLTASDEAHLRYISASGEVLFETGRATGTLPGSMRVHMRIAATFSGRFTIYAAGGSISGHGSATPHGAGVYESFSGSLTVSGGDGRYRHARGTARLYGTFNRMSYALVIQTRGTLHY